MPQFFHRIIHGREKSGRMTLGIEKGIEELVPNVIRIRIEIALQEFH